MPADDNNLGVVALIFILVVVGANLLMWGKARGMRDFRGKDFFNLGHATKPWKKEADDLRELSQRVRELKSRQKDEEP